MLPRHGRDQHSRAIQVRAHALSATLLALRASLDLDKRALERVKRRDGRELLLGRFLVVEMRLGVRRADDGQVAPEGGFDFAVEVVS